MKKTITYKTHGTCSRSIEIVIDGDTVESVIFNGGCDGNTHGLENLVAGMKTEDVISKLKGIKCGFKDTSCPDQLAIALEKAVSDGESTDI